MMNNYSKLTFATKRPTMGITRPQSDRSPAYAAAADL